MALTFKGHASSTLAYGDGVIHLTYNDGKANCHGKHTRESHIDFLCDYSEPFGEYSELFSEYTQLFSVYSKLFSEYSKLFCECGSLV